MHGRHVEVRYLPNEIAERKRGLAGKVRAGWMRREERRGVWKDILYGPLAEQGKS